MVLVRAGWGGGGFNYFLSIVRNATSKVKKNPAKINLCALYEIRSGTKRHIDVCDFINLISEISIGASGRRNGEARLARSGGGREN